jgi:hypothetical protein
MLKEELDLIRGKIDGKVISLKCTGDRWYAVEGEWCRRLLKNDDNPPFNNINILKDDKIELKDHGNKDIYYLFHESDYKKLKSWFGGGPDVMREVVEHSNIKIINTSPFFLKASIKGSSDPSVLIGFFKMFDAPKIIKKIIKCLRLNSDNIIRIWNTSKKETPSIISFTDFKTFEIGLKGSKEIEVELLSSKEVDQSNLNENTIFYCGLYLHHLQYILFYFFF